MENNFKGVIERADKDAVNLKDSGDLALAAQGLQTLFDETTNMAYGKRELLVNAYVKEVNTKADDIYGKGQHITLEIVDTNNNEHIDVQDHILAKHVDGTNSNLHISALERANNSY
jgi:hypothetical protein